MIKIINDIQIKTIEEISNEYPGLACLITDVEIPFENGITIYPRGRLYAVADEEDYFKLHELARPFIEKNIQIMVDDSNLDTKYPMIREWNAI